MMNRAFRLVCIFNPKCFALPSLLAHRWCIQEGFFSGFGAVEHSGDNLSVVYLALEALLAGAINIRPTVPVDTMPHRLGGAGYRSIDTIVD